MRRQRLNQTQGFLFVSTLFVLTSLLMLSAVGLNRSMTELLVANRFIAGTQALHLAEAAVDETLTEFTRGGTDGIRRNFSLSAAPSPNDGWSNGAPCATAGCRTKQLVLSDSTVTVIVDNILAPAPTITADSTVTGTRRQVTVNVVPQAGFPKILGGVMSVQDDAAVQYVNQNGDDDKPFDFEDDTPPWTISGVDTGFAEAGCTDPGVGDGTQQAPSPGITTTDDGILSHPTEGDLADEVSPPRTDLWQHIRGAKSAYNGSWDSWDPKARSIYSAEGDPDVPQPSDVEAFVQQACGPGIADNLILNASSATLVFTGQTWGTPGTASGYRITCIGTDHSTGERKVRLRNINGAGVLIVKANMSLDSGTLNWDGLVISYGRDSEFDWDSSGTIRGAVMVVATQNTPYVGEFEMGNTSNVRLIQSCSCCINKARKRLVDRGLPANPKTTIRLWQSN